MDSNTRAVRLCTGLRQSSTRELLQSLTLSCEKNISEAGRIQMRDVHAWKDSIRLYRVIYVPFLVNKVKIHINWREIEEKPSLTISVLFVENFATWIRFLVIPKREKKETLSLLCVKYIKRIIEMYVRLRINQLWFRTRHDINI